MSNLFKGALNDRLYDFTYKTVFLLESEFEFTFLEAKAFNNL